MPTSTAGRLNNRSGFTLIELMLVILLLGMMAGLIMPLISGFDPNRLNSSASRLAGTVKYLYNEAAMTGQEHRLIFNFDKAAYHAEKINALGEWVPLLGVGDEHKLGEGVRFVNIYQPGKGERSDGEVTTTLLPGGWLEETIIYLQDKNDKKLTLRLVPLTGRTQIFDGFRSFR
ncbi:pilus assembly FimT family protein [Geopsychrobacter electrodiphilus]|uniref:pilus assembly FimT family protein n=1 Tax=Geopsychrobacter electrodiphilus TaxID=225196 RepID=UPI00146E5814|nr:prepilin-type N-terminal cleavage/methylation domain-containing protein [Geopsychrobacter electrodiphilus]